MAANAVKSTGNVTLSYNASPLASYIDSLVMKGDGTEIDVTNLASTGAESLTGFSNWTFDVGGPWDAVFDAILAPDRVTPGTKRTLIAVFTDKTPTSVTWTWTLNAEVQNYTVNGAVADAIKWSATIKCSGAPVRT